MLIENMLLPTIIAAGLLNVWIFRNSKNTSYRGGSSKNLKQEFEAYGLPSEAYYLVGFLKLTCALVLLVSYWMPSLRLYAAGVITFLMIGALLMHLKVKDPIKKSIPAFAMLIMSSSLVYISLMSNA